MPKVKSHSGAKKRFRVSASGKVKFSKPGRGHFLTEKSSNRRRKIKKGSFVNGKHAENIKRMINS